MDSILSSLNSKFHCEGVSFAFWNGLPSVKISNRHCDATVALNGAHVCEFTPKGKRPLLWLSGSSNFTPGKPIRGGIPVCWPWFGPSMQPAHGFARISQWDVESVKSEADGSTTLTLKLESSDATLAVWPHKFKCLLELKAGAAMDVSLKVLNTGDAPFTCTGALHTYIPVSKITDVKVLGLESVGFVNSIDGSKHAAEGHPIEFGFELDRLYSPTEGDCIIEDFGWGRRVRVRREGSRSAVVWNPWIAKAQRMPDFGDNEYWTMVCVEAANAGDDVVSVAPGASHTLRTVVQEI